MTANTPRLTDDLLRRALAELADGPDGDALLAEVLRRVDTAPQVVRRPWDTRRWGRAGLLLVAALLLVGAIGAVIALSSPPPEPMPGPQSQAVTVTGFVQPFSYRLPAEHPVRLTHQGPGGDVVMAVKSETGTLELFLVTGDVHACADNPTLDETGFDPSRFMDALSERLGDGMGPIRPASLGNLSGLAAEIDPSRSDCQEVVFHEHGLGWGPGGEPQIQHRSTLIVAGASYGTIGVVISAETDEEYEAWLPIAQAYVDSFVFETLRPLDRPE